MTSIKIIVAFLFAHIIGSALTICTAVEYESQNLDAFAIILKLLMAYDLLVLIAFTVTIVLLFVSNARNSTGVLIIDTASSNTSHTLDLEEK